MNHTCNRKRIRKPWGSFGQAIVIALLAFCNMPAAWAVQNHQSVALVKEAEELRSMGFHEKAAIVLTKALALPHGDLGFEALIKSDLGNTLQLMGMLKEARVYLDSSIDLAKAEERLDILAAAFNNMGNLNAVDNRYEEAISNYEASAELALKTHNPELRVQALINEVRVVGRNGGNTKVQLEDALKVVRSLNDGAVKANDLLAIGQLYGFPDEGAESDVSKAYVVLNEALAVAQRASDKRSESYALGFLGRLYEKERLYPDALELTHRAIFIGEQLNAPEILYRWYWQKGRLLKAQHKKDEAIVAYRQAVSDLQSIRNDLSQNYSTGQSSFRRIFSPLFFELADLLLERASTTGGAEATRYLDEARDAVEKSKTAELQDYFRDTCVTTAQSNIVQGGPLERHTAVIYPVLLEDRLELLVTLPGGIRQFRVAVGSKDVTEEIRTFRIYLEKRITRQYLPHAQKLYSWLIRPFEAELAAQHIDTLVFVPDGPLRTIPMSALYDGGKFLIERYAIATTPGLTLTDPHPLAQRKIRLLLNGLTEPVQGFSALPNVNGELKAIKNEYQNATVLKDESYVLQNVKEKMSEAPYSVVHIASHGQFKSDSGQTFILTHDGKLTLNQLQKLIAPTRYSEQPIELLTLSACQTAAGDDRAALGLAGIAIKAGARSALASLWFINDSSSSELMSKFYDYLKRPGVTKARALQEAQVDLIHDTRYKHPGYWAPFLLIGNWL